MPVIDCAECGETVPGPGYSHMQESAQCERCYRERWPGTPLTLAAKAYGDGRPWTESHTRIACTVLCQAATDAARKGDLDLMSRIIAVVHPTLSEPVFIAAARSGLLGSQADTGVTPADHAYYVRVRADWTEFERGPDGRKLIAQYSMHRVSCGKCAIEHSCFPIDPNDRTMSHGILYWEGDPVPGGDVCDHCHKKVGTTHGDESDVLGYAFDSEFAEIHTRECVECFEYTHRHALEYWKNSKYVTAITGDAFELGKGFTCTNCTREVTT